MTAGAGIPDPSGASTACWVFERFGRPTDVLRLVHADEPEVGPGQVAVEIRAVGLNQADERYVRGEHFPPKTLPACAGHEAVGRVLAVGEGVDAPCREGDRVALLPMLIDRRTMGALRKVGVYDASALLPVPPRYTDAEAAAYWIGILTMAGAMDMAGLGPETSAGRTVVFTAAAGGMGTLAIQLARAWGAHVVATTRRPQKAEALGALGAQVVLAADPTALAAALQHVSHDRPVDAVIDPLGGEIVEACLSVLGPGGQYVCYEAVTGKAASFDILRLMAGDQSLHGYTFFRPLAHPGLLDDLVRIGLSEAERVRPVVAAEYPFERAPEALDAVRRGAHVGKIVVTV